MRDRIKRLIAGMLALVLLITTLIPDNLLIVQASSSSNSAGNEAQQETKNIVVNLGSPIIGDNDMSKLPGFVQNHSLDLTLKVTYSDGTNSEQKSFNANNAGLEGVIPYNSSYTYTYALESENYNITLADSKAVNGTLTAEEVNSGVVLAVVSVEPKYSIQSIEGNDQIEVGESVELQAVLNQGEDSIWNKDQISWSVEGDNASYVTLSQNETDSAKCTVTGLELPLDVNSVAVTLRATGANASTNTVTKVITISKKQLGITITTKDGGDWHEASVVVQLSEAVSKEVTLYDNNGEISKKTTDDSGKAIFTLSANEPKTYKLTAKTEADNIYLAGSTDTEIEYTPANRKQEFTFALNKNESGEDVSVTYGETKVIGLVNVTVGENTGDYTAKAITIVGEEERENGTVTVDNETGNVTYEPAFAGEAEIRIVKNAVGNYNQSDIVSNIIQVNKKIVTVESVTATSKTYDGEMENIHVEASLKDTVNETITLKTDKGKVDSSDAGEQEVEATLIMSEIVFQKYAFKTDDGSLTNSIKVTPTVNVKPAPLKVTVDNASIEWQYIKDENEKKSKLCFPPKSNIFTYEGFINNDVPENILELTKNDIEYGEINNIEVDKTFENVLGIRKDEETGKYPNVYENYEITEVIAGDLELTKETNFSFTKYIEIDNSKNLLNHVYQPNTNAEIIYYGEDAESNMSEVETNRGAVAVFKFKADSPYSRLWSVEGESAEDVTDNGITLTQNADGHVEKTFYLTDEDGNIKTDTFSVTFTSDQKAPDVTIKEGENNVTLDALTEKITFGLFHNSKKTISINVNEMDAESGISSWSYCKIATINDDNSLSGINEDLSIEEKENIIKNEFSSAESPVEFIPVEDSNVEFDLDNNGYYVVYAVATDNVGNSVLVGSNGVIIENIQLDIIDVELNGETSTDEVKYFNDDVDLHITIDDNDSSIYTGVLHSNYMFKMNGVDIGNLNGFGTSGSVELKLDDVSVDAEKYGKLVDNTGYVTSTPVLLSLADIHAYTIDKTLSVSTNQEISRKFDVTIEATDFAENPLQKKNVSFVIDKIKPEITTLEITTEKAANAEDGYYSAEKVDVVVKIKERFLDKSGVMLTVTKDGVEHKLSLEDTSELGTLGIYINGSSISEGDEEKQNDESESIIALEFKEDADYVVEVSVTDKAGNMSAESKSIEFHKDKTPPEVDFSFDTSDVQNGKYYKNNKTLYITVNERNFDSSYTPQVTSSTGGGYSFSGWSTVGETTTGSITFSGDGDYSVTYECYDLAGNKSNIEILEEFIIDQTAPDIEKFCVSTLEDEKAEPGYFNNDKVEVVTKIKERFLKEENVKFKIIKDNETVEKSLSEEDIADLEELGITVDATLNVNSESTITLVFTEEADYTVEVNATDMVGKTNDQKEDDNIIEFHIDRTPPVVDLTYYAYNSNYPLVESDGKFTASSDRENPVYLGKGETSDASFEVEVNVNERNFILNNASASYIVSAVNSNDETTAFTAKYNEDTVEDIATHFLDINNWSNQKYRLSFTDDANYSFSFQIYDKAGNESEVVGKEYVTLDNTKPNGTISAEDLVNGENTFIKWVNKFFDTITFGLFGNSSVTAKMESSDETSGESTNQYYISEIGMSREELKKLGDGLWNDYTEPVPISANKNVIVYQKVADKAGNTEYYSSDSFVLDNKEPAPEITITPTVPAWKKGVYSASDDPGFVVTVTDPINNNAFSGLKEVTYTIKDEDSSVSGTILSSEQSRGKHLQELPGGSATIYINPNEFYSNNVKVTVTASDWSANSPEPVSTELKIDNKPPEVEFSFDTSDVQNGKYYKNNKTLYITVNERNFDPSYTPQVTSSTGGGYSFSGWSTVGETTTGSITFSGDGDYSVTYDCYDLAGNKSNTKTQEEFTVDKTTPVINVSYDNNSAQNGNYYKAARTATITINEHNFNASDVQVATTASNGSAPRVSGWSNSGDRHTATVYFGSDADYTFDISYTDMAGNNAADYAQDSFTVDLTNPVVEITGVANKSANKGTVAPTITLNDTNFIGEGVTLTLTGANKGKIDISSMVTRTSTETGQSITFRNFGDNMDDIYTLTAKSVDKAGNETSRTITFSVNRHGSTYELNDETEKLVNKGYTNSPVDVVIEEYNVDSLEFIELSYSKDGEIVKLTRNKDYTVKEEGSDGQWKKYTYTIYAKCFEEEGEYNINISSVDRAQNESNNKVQSMNVAFVVDKTAPTMAISNLENRGRYTANIHQFTLNVKDNTRLSKVELYLDGKLVHTYEGDELIVEDGKIYIDIDSKGEYQTVKLIAYDEAGNPTEPAEYDVLVTSNRWVQFVANKPLFYGAIVALAVAAGFIFFLIFWKKKKKEGQK